MFLTFVKHLNHWWVLLLGILIMIRAVFSLVDVNNNGKRLIIWGIVLAIGASLILGFRAADGLNNPTKHTAVKTQQN